MMNDMSPRNLSPRTSSPSNSPRSYTPTKRGYDSFAFDKTKTLDASNDIAPVGTSTFTPSIMADENYGSPFGRSVRQRRDDDHQMPFLSSSLPAQPTVQPSTFAPSFDKMLSPPSPSTYAHQFPLFGVEHSELENGAHGHFDLAENHTPQKPLTNDSQFSFSMNEFKLNTDSSMVLSEPSMFDFDTL